MYLPTSFILYLVQFSVPSGPPRDLDTTNVTENSFVVTFIQTRTIDINGIFTEFKVEINESFRNGSVVTHEFYAAASNASMGTEGQSSPNASSFDAPQLRRRRQAPLETDLPDQTGGNGPLSPPEIPTTPNIPVPAIDPLLSTVSTGVADVVGDVINTANQVLNTTNDIIALNQSSSTTRANGMAMAYANIANMKQTLINKVYFTVRHTSFGIDVSGLIPYTVYNISISTCTVIGCGPTANRNVRTDESGELLNFFMNQK